MHFAPGEEGRVADKAVFNHLGIARPHLAFRQRVERRGVDQDRRRLVEGADEVLAPRGVDGGLPADRRIDLREQGGRYLHISAAALEDRGCAARQVADHAAAESHTLIGALDTKLNQPRSEEHTSELQSLMRSSYAVFCLKKKKKTKANS